jgi:hypothetical protein
MPNSQGKDFPTVNPNRKDGQATVNSALSRSDDNFVSRRTVRVHRPKQIQLRLGVIFLLSTVPMLSTRSSTPSLPFIEPANAPC